MEIKKTVELNAEEKATLNSAEAIITGVCEEYNTLCEECPLFKICDILQCNLNTDFELTFAKVVNILTKER